MNASSDDPVFVAGYRAALARVSGAIATDPIAVTSAQAYRAAVDIEAMQTHTAADMPGRRLLERSLFDAKTEGSRQAKQLKALTRISALRKTGRDQAREDLAAARETRDVALAALVRVVVLCDQYEAEIVASIPVGELRAVLDERTQDDP